jgi:drug/metabolite transporter (DMT)-like permease
MPPPSNPTPPQSAIPQSAIKGILYMTVGTMVLTTHDAISKLLLDWLHVGEIIAWRGLLSIPIVLLLVRLEGDTWRSLKSAAPWQTFLRGLFGLITSFLVILSFKVMPLADALAIIFSSPLMVTALSAIFLKEHVGWRRWTATSAGFAGAVLIVGPSFDAVGLWALAPIGAALASALRDIISRRLGSRDSGPSILFWTMIVSMVGGLISLPFLGTSMPSPAVWGLLLTTALLITLAYRLNIAAFTIASGAIVAPLRYLSLVWAAILGYALWQDVPDLRAVAGTVIIIAAGLYIWRREAMLERGPAAARKIRQGKGN